MCGYKEGKKGMHPKHVVVELWLHVCPKYVQKHKVDHACSVSPHSQTHKTTTMGWSGVEAVTWGLNQRFLVPSGGVPTPHCFHNGETDWLTPHWMECRPARVMCFWPLVLRIGVFKSISRFRNKVTYGACLHISSPTLCHSGSLGSKLTALGKTFL